MILEPHYSGNPPFATIIKDNGDLKVGMTGRILTIDFINMVAEFKLNKVRIDQFNIMNISFIPLCYLDIDLTSNSISV